MAVAGSEPTAETADTTDGTTYTLGAFTPTADAILVVFVYASDTTDDGAMTGGSLTWTRKSSLIFGGINDQKVYLFWAKTGSSPGSTTITFDCTGDNATGAIMTVMEWTGVDIVSSDPFRQVATNTGLTPAAPTVTFSSALLTENGYGYGFGLEQDSSPAVTPPSGWTETADTGYATPNSGAAFAYKATGLTGTTYAWTFDGSGASDLGWGAIAYEINAAAGAGQPACKRVAGVEFCPGPTGVFGPGRVW